MAAESQPSMKWPTRLKIAIGAARGLAYLHEDCMLYFFCLLTSTLFYYLFWHCSKLQVIRRLFIETSKLQIFYLTPTSKQRLQTLALQNLLQKVLLVSTQGLKGLLGTWIQNMCQVGNWQINLMFSLSVSCCLSWSLAAGL